MRFEPVHACHAIGRRQRGVALIIVVVLLLIGVGAALFAFFRPASQAIERDKVTAAALAQASAALIGRAAIDNNRPGTLPCPDLITNIPGINVPNDGIADLLVGNDCPSYIGRLPWRTLGLGDLRDGSGERLWYALSNTLRDDNSAQPINSDTPGILSVVGTSPAANVVAILFAPGPTLGAQSRDVAGENNVTNYLEGENANGDNIYTTGTTSSIFNDQVFAVTGDTLFRIVEYRVAREIRARLAAYFAANSYYPFASAFGDPNFSCNPLLRQGRLPKPGVLAQYDISTGCPGLPDWPLAAQPPAWFTTNNWHLLTYYTVASACTNVTPGCAGIGYLTVNNAPAPTNDKQALVIVAGRALTGQVRPCASVVDCLEDLNSDGDDIYIKNPVSSVFNDKLTIVAP